MIDKIQVTAFCMKQKIRHLRWRLRDTLKQIKRQNENTFKNFVRSLHNYPIFFFFHFLTS